jgi:hypothetical protein
VSLAYISATHFVSHHNHVPQFLVAISVVTTVLAVLTALFFESEPVKPPSMSADMKRKMKDSGEEDRNFTFDGVMELLQCHGFLHTILGFTMAESVLNTYSTFFNAMLHQYGYHQHMIGLLGTIFFVAVTIGGPLFGVLVGQSYKPVIIILSFLSMSSIAFLQMMSYPLNGVNITAAVVLIGFFVGPIQPLYAELGVEVAFPASENLIFALQQIIASLFSSIFVLVLQDFEDPKTYAIDVVNYVMLGWIAFGTMIFFTFNAPLKRPRQYVQHGAWSVDVVDHIQSFKRKEEQVAGSL